MPDHSLPEDDAALYVLGGLNPAQRREFEARLAQSAELRALVGELNEGNVALALTAPVKRPPAKVWHGIEKAVAEERRQNAVIPAFWAGWWRHGWAAAAACLVGWLLYAVWVNRPHLELSAPAVASETHSRPETAWPDPNSSNARAGTLNGQTFAASNSEQQLLQIKTREINGLRGQLADLELRSANLSQIVTQQQGLLAEPDRIKFFQLTPGSNGSGAVITTTLTPDLQRALFTAMARELGWAPPTNATPAPNSEAGKSNSVSGVDFADLRNGTNGPLTSLPARTPSATTNTQDALPPTAPPGSSVPAFVSGSNMFFAFDSTLASSGSVISVVGEGLGSLGYATMGSNPMVMAIPFTGGTGSTGGTISIYSGVAAPSGTTAVITNIFQYYIPGTTN